MDKISLEALGRAFEATAENGHVECLDRLMACRRFGEITDLDLAKAYQFCHPDCKEKIYSRLSKRQGENLSKKST